MWIVGQRVFSELEPELGLGLIIRVTGNRFVEVLFSGAEVTRRYSPESAPLRRVRLANGQKVQTKDGVVFIVQALKEDGGLILYVGEGAEQAWEYELAHLVEDRETLHRFLIGQWSPPKAFPLRVQAWAGRSLSLDPDLRGLVGPRVSLLPHQIFIAHETSQRDYPRVLLADEVGLGKTIEAGLIFSAMKALGRAQRVLILVPDALKHQWLSELYRCFHEMFSVVDEEISEQEALSQGISAFRMNQYVICSLELLLEDELTLEEAQEEPWDLLIVDEAHYLRWSEDEVSPEWEAVRALSRRSRGLLLLTATPEVEGLETKFGLLHLVDPERFANFDVFQEASQTMRHTAKLAHQIFSREKNEALFKDLDTIRKQDPSLKDPIEAYRKGEAPEPLLRALIDRHGTGRVLIRNRRSRLKGFPGRVYLPAPLEAPEAWRHFLETLKTESAEEQALMVLAGGQGLPRRGKGGAEAFQARCQWLLQLLTSLKGEKALLITSRKETVLALEAWLRAHSGVRLAVFHEELEVVERDRQAAWFAQKEGAQVLLCSEIGGEGRNFQFCHHLVLFDLPYHPDLLEQRIGRLDRIGQKAPVQIHVPYFTNTPEEVLVKWYAEGLESFTLAWGGGGVVLGATMDLLLEAIKSRTGKPKKTAQAATKRLLEKTRAGLKSYLEHQKESIDILVDLNSFDEVRGNSLVEKIKERDADPLLPSFMDSAFDYFGVESESMDAMGTVKVTAHSLTRVENFPGLTAHGERLITYQRPHALSREELAFLSWDHPMVQGALSLILEGQEGKAGAAVWKRSPKPGQAFIECLFVLHATAPAYLEIERDLPIQSWQIALTLDGKILHPYPVIDLEDLQPLPSKVFFEHFGELRTALVPVLDEAQAAVKKQAETRIAQAKKTLEQRYKEQRERLVELARVNPSVTPREIAELEEKRKASLNALEHASPRLDAMRFLLGGE